MSRSLSSEASGSDVGSVETEKKQILRKVLWIFESTKTNKLREQNLRSFESLNTKNENQLWSICGVGGCQHYMISRLRFYAHCWNPGIRIKYSCWSHKTGVISMLVHVCGALIFCMKLLHSAFRPWTHRIGRCLYRCLQSARGVLGCAIALVLLTCDFALMLVLLLLVVAFPVVTGVLPSKFGPYCGFYSGLGSKWYHLPFQFWDKINLCYPFLLF